MGKRGGLKLTNHAARRFLERAPESLLACLASVRSQAWNRIRAAVEALVVTPELRRLHRQLGDGRYPVRRSGLVAVIKHWKIVTILPPAEGRDSAGL